MDPNDPQELAERVARLEAQVAWLWQRQQTPGAPASAPRPAPRRPAPQPPGPRREISPVVWIAGMGAAIFLSGTIFFFRWTIQQGWVGPEWRFLLGLLAGGGLSVLAGRRLLGDSRRLGVALLLAGLGTLQFAFRAGAMEYHFYAAPLGLAATALITLVAGGLAARSHSDGALTVALASGLLAPLVFSQGGHHELALALYLAVLIGAALAVPYLSRRGGSYHRARWTALLGVWLWLLPACLEILRTDATPMAGLLVAHLILAGFWAWLPGLQETPGTPTALWLVASILATTNGWTLWPRLGLAPETYALPVIGMAALNLALVQPLRRRLGDRSADGGLLALAVGHLTLAVPVALAWAWVGPLWGTFALGLAWASLKAEAGAFATEARALRWLAAALALLTSCRWAFRGLDGLFFHGGTSTPFFNGAFAEGALAAAAWWMLTRRGGPLGLGSFLALEVVANATLALEVAGLVQRIQAPTPFGHGLTRAASIALTLVWALSGAWQWMRGLSQPAAARRALMIAGYAWMGIASFKLVAMDLANANTPLRALAFLGVGGIGMAAAILANRQRRGETS